MLQGNQTSAFSHDKLKLREDEIILQGKKKKTWKAKKSMEEKKKKKNSVYHKDTSKPT